MTQIVKSLLFLSLLLFIVGCKKETYQLNEEFTLSFNQSAFVSIDGVKHIIKFTELVEETRCPPDVNCYWMGEVSVNINMNNDTDIILGHHTTLPSALVYDNLTIVLLEVNYNKKKNYGKERHYSVKLRIE